MSEQGSVPGAGSDRAEGPDWRAEPEGAAVPVELDSLGRPKRVPPVGKKAPAVTQEIAERRVNAVFAAIVNGLQPWEIRQAVAQQQVKERRAREKALDTATKQGAEDPRAESLHDVPMVWGDDPMPLRTFARYLSRARAELENRVPEFAKQRGRMLAQAQARLDMVYAHSVKDSRWYAALKAIELSAEMFGLRDYAKNAALLHELQGRAGTLGDDEQDGTSMPTSPDDRAAAFAALAAAAIAMNPALKDQIGAMLSAPPATRVMP